MREALAPVEKKNLYYRDVPTELREELWRRFGEAIAPLQQAGELGVVLFQFPPWFLPSKASFIHLQSCQAHLPGTRLAVEFRNKAWFEGHRATEVLAFAREHGLAHVVVDEPQGFASSMPALWEATHPEVAVVRLRGCNAHTWNLRGLQSSAEQFKHLHNAEELEALAHGVTRLVGEAQEVHVLFNNNYEHYAYRNARNFGRWV